MTDSLENPEKLTKENVFDRLAEINPTLYELFEKCVTKILEKNNDYAGNDDFYQNFRDSEEIDTPAWKGIWIRFGDKRRRIVNFIRGQKMLVRDESFVDTCIDGANYILLMLACWLDDRASKAEFPNYRPNEDLYYKSVDRRS